MGGWANPEFSVCVCECVFVSPPPPFPGVWGRVVRVGAEGRALGSGKEW